MRAALITAVLLAVGAQAQEAADPVPPARFHIYGQLGGSALLGGSVNVEFVPVPAFAMRGGAGVTATLFEGPTSTLSGAFAALLGRGNYQLEVSAGALQVTGGNSGYFLEGGMRRSIGRAAVLRIVLTVVREADDEDSLLLPGVSLGGRF